MMNVNSPRKQRGVATVLIVLLLALSLSVAVLTGIQYNRAAQEQAISLHAQTQAQAQAWEAAEVVRLYFDELRNSPEWLKDDGVIRSIFSQIETKASESADGFLLDIPELIGAEARVKKAWLTPEGQPSFQVEITAKGAAGTRADATSKLEIVLVYSVSDLQRIPSSNLVSFGGDTDLSGGIKIMVEPGQTYNLAVDGNVTLGGISVQGADNDGGINSILSTRSIRFVGGSSNFFEKLHANCDIQLGAGASAAGLILARNNVCTRNTSNPAGGINQEVRANGSIYHTGGNWGDLIALAGQGDHQSCPVDAENYCGQSGEVPYQAGVQMNAVTTADNIITHGWVTMTDSVVNSNLKAEKGLSRSRGTVGSLDLAGGASCTEDGGDCANVSWLDNPLAQQKPVTEVEIRPETLDVSTLGNHANFIFEHDGTAIRVSVKNIAGIPNGDYRLCHPEINYNIKANYLCATDGSGFRSPGPFLLGSWEGDSGALQYAADSQTWTLKGTHENGQLGMVPGMVIFKGNLEVSGVFINTFAATGNIRTMADLKVYALNYSGYDGTREGVADVFGPADVGGVCTQSQFPGLYPEKLCDTENREFRFKAIAGYGNYGLLAGSCKPGTECEKPHNYLGGDISLGASNRIYGAVKAGAGFDAAGSSMAFGFVSGLGVQQHTLGASFTIDLTRLPEGYDPSGNSSLDNSGANNVESETLIFWSRYL